MSTLRIYCAATAAFLALQAAPLLMGPSLVITLTEQARNPTELETDLTRLLALALFTLAGLSLVPIFSTISTTTFAPDAGEAETPSDLTNVNSSGPTLLITIAYHILRAAHSYSRYLSTGKGGTFLPGTIASVILAVMGIGCALFSGERERGSSWLFTPVQKRAKHVEKREARLDKLKKKT